MEPRVRVLIVSENPVERLRAASGLLSSADVEIVEAASADAAHRAVAAGGIDVMVVDGDLQPEGGFSLVYEVRAASQLYARSAPPSVVMMGREQDRWLADWAGTDDVLTKPADPFKLASLVRGLYGAGELTVV